MNKFFRKIIDIGDKIFNSESLYSFTSFWFRIIEWLIIISALIYAENLTKSKYISIIIWISLGLFELYTLNKIFDISLSKLRKHVNRKNKLFSILYLFLLLGIFYLLFKYFVPFLSGVITDLSKVK